MHLPRPCNVKVVARKKWCTFRHVNSSWRLVTTWRKLSFLNSKVTWGVSTVLVVFTAAVKWRVVELCFRPIWPALLDFCQFWLAWRNIARHYPMAAFEWALGKPGCPASAPGYRLTKRMLKTAEKKARHHARRRLRGFSTSVLMSKVQFNRHKSKRSTVEPSLPFHRTMVV